MVPRGGNPVAWTVTANVARGGKLVVLTVGVDPFFSGFLSEFRELDVPPTQNKKEQN